MHKILVCMNRLRLHSKIVTTKRPISLKLPTKICLNCQQVSFFSSNLPTHYDTLGINPTASKEEIKAAYIELSKKYHPDRIAQDKSTKEETTDFLQISQAFNVLSNETSRKMYDLELFKTSATINRFSSGEYKLHREEKNRKKSRKNLDEENQDVLGFSSLTPRIRSLLHYLYGAIFAIIISMILLSKRNANDKNEKETKSS
uniref:dnaJ homolog subfamily C member 4 n=1 Tax=Ciona intestinalis TaxID=7719 RepID=UPI000180CC0D|nr:dnaJ homolog subfamily C member 4 [Ciona intestinalis]|eukprot:XP_002121827.1 dnaJ homolog subfamily C member 4 [Ciona intestinalis]